MSYSEYTEYTLYITKHCSKVHLCPRARSWKWTSISEKGWLELWSILSSLFLRLSQWLLNIKYVNIAYSKVYTLYVPIPDKYPSHKTMASWFLFWSLPGQMILDFFSTQWHIFNRLGGECLLPPTTIIQERLWVIADWPLRGWSIARAKV